VISKVFYLKPPPTMAFNLGGWDNDSSSGPGQLAHSKKGFHGCGPWRELNCWSYFFFLRYFIYN
jgi:hypothetical protein